jgi:periplasmic divalent cation tolerance protein
MNDTAGMILVYTTFAEESDARELGRHLVEEGLAACVNIIPGMMSIYRWENATETANEAVMLVKTAKALQGKVLEVMAARHPYSVPALIVLEPRAVSASYIEWLCNQTAPALGPLGQK